MDVFLKIIRVSVFKFIFQQGPASILQSAVTHDNYNHLSCRNCGYLGALHFAFAI
jgi:hypothetical protein